MEYAGAASGAALGFIAGNVPGAYIGGNLGYALGKNYSKKGNMGKLPATPKSSGKKRKLSLSGPAQSRRRSIASSMSSGSSRASSRGIVVKVKAAENQTARAAKVKKTVDQYKTKVKKTVKVPKLLRKQVKQILDSKDVYGYWRGILCGSSVLVESPTWNNQAVFPLPMPIDGAAVGREKMRGHLFSPEFFQMVAARLFNGRKAGALNSWDEIYKESSVTAPEWKNFDQLNNNVPAGKFTIEKTFAIVKMKNNTPRTVYLKMYVAKPKYQRVSGTMAGNDGHCVNDWTTQLNMEGQANIDGEMLPFDQNTRKLAINIDNSLKTFSLNSCPTKVESLKSLWAFEKFAITLEPGQVHTQYIAGDSMDLDYSKMVVKSQNSTTGLSFADVQKFSRHVFFTGYPELAYAYRDGDSTNGGWRCRYPDASYKLLFETEIHCKIKMPEPTGGVMPVNTLSDPNGGRIFTNNSRKRAYCFDFFGVTNGTTNPQYNYNIDDNEPKDIST